MTNDNAKRAEDLLRAMGYGVGDYAGTLELLERPDSAPELQFFVDLMERMEAALYMSK